jgi:hypothetical protein
MKSLHIILIAVIIASVGCNKEDVKKDYGTLPNLTGTKWVANRVDEYGFNTTQRFIFITDSTGTFETTQFTLSSGYIISAFKEETVWALNGESIYVHFDRTESDYFPEDMNGSYKWNDDGVSVLTIEGRAYKKY